tara:strand:+ start:449 stop:850 length:402 start_codon:yes stop_codon:yes gene_type:complete
MGLKMKNFFLVILFSWIPLSALSEVGDLYYCEMTQAVEIKKGKLINYIPQKFKFRIIKKDLIEFGQEANYFSGLELKVLEYSSNGEQFYGENFEYSFGSFYFADVFRWPSEDMTTLTATMLSAECSVVDDYSV